MNGLPNTQSQSNFYNRVQCFPIFSLLIYFTGQVYQKRPVGSSCFPEYLTENFRSAKLQEELAEMHNGV